MCSLTVTCGLLVFLENATDYSDRGEDYRGLPPFDRLRVNCSSHSLAMTRRKPPLFSRCFTSTSLSAGVVRLRWIPSAWTRGRRGFHPLSCLPHQGGDDGGMDYNPLRLLRRPAADSQRQDNLRACIRPRYVCYFGDCHGRPGRPRNDKKM